MTTTIFVIAILAMLALVSFGFTAVRHLVTVEANNNSDCSKQPVTRILKLEEIEAVKEYAQIFGLHNDTDVDAYQLLKLGQKAKCVIGEDRFEELSELVKSGEPVHTYVVESNSDMKAQQHRINKMLVECSLITVPSFVVINEIRGGDRGGEETTSTRIAA
jgi:hypothetical protein